MHSAVPVVLYSWGSDTDQTADTTQSFLNASLDAVRGRLGDGVGEYLTTHWLPLMRDRIKPTTMNSYQRMIEGYVVPRLGGVKLQELTTAQLNAMPAANNDTCTSCDQLNLRAFRYNVPGKDPNDKYNGRFDQQLIDSPKWGSHKVEFVYHTGEFLLTPDTFNAIEAPFPGGVDAFQGSTRTLWTTALQSSRGAFHSLA